MKGLKNGSIESFKWPYVMRRVPGTDGNRLLPLPDSLEAGDVLLTQIEKIGKNARIELTDGRVANLYEGDRLGVVLGNRYATEQFEGYARVRGDACDLLSMGGLCGTVESRHAAVAEPTQLRILGALGNDDGKRLRLSDYSVAETPYAHRPRVIVVCGSSMDVGKTHTARSLILGLRRLGRPVAGIKLTGTAAGRDTWSMLDSGAGPVFDFVDGGLPSTYLCSVEQLHRLYELLVGNAGAAGAAWAVIEIADGVLQRETVSLLRCESFVSSVDAWLYATGDALGAVGGIAALNAHGIEPLATSGLISMSPLAMKEAHIATRVRCLSARELQDGALNESLTALPAARIAVPSPRRSTMTARAFGS